MLKISKLKKAERLHRKTTEEKVFTIYEICKDYTGNDWKLFLETIDQLHTAYQTMLKIKTKDEKDPIVQTEKDLELME